MHVSGDDRVAQGLRTGNQAFGDIDRVFAGLFGDLQRDSWIFAPNRDAYGFRGGTGASPHITRGLIGAVADISNVGNVDGLRVEDAHHKLAHVGGRFQLVAGFDHDGFVIAHQHACRCGHVGRLQRVFDVQRGDTERRQPIRVQLHAQHAARPADRVHFTCSGHALEFDLRRVRDAFDVISAAIRRIAPHRQRDDRHIVDALGLDDRIEDAELARYPVAVRVDRVVQPHQCVGAGHADFELHGQRRQAGARHREDMLHADHLRQHLLRRCGDQRFHISHACTGKRHKHVGHRHIDLRLFLARRHRD